MIKIDELQSKKKGTRYDSGKKKWIGYRVDLRVAGKRLRPLFPTRAEAEKYVAQVTSQKKYTRAGVKAPIVSSIRFSNLAEKRKTRIKNEKELIRAERVFPAFALVLESDILVTEIRSSHIQKFINRRFEDGVKASTVNREVTLLSTALKEAKDLFPEELENFEAPQIPRPKFSRKKRHRRTIEPFEKDRLIHSIINDRRQLERPQRTAARPVIALMFEVGWMLGLRYTEVKKIKKADFDAGRATVRVTRWKTNDVTVMDFLPDRVVEILSSQIETQGEYVFNLPCSEHTFAAVLKDACLANGIPYGRAELDGVTFHSTRHSFTTRMTEAAGIGTTQFYTSHSNREMAAYYSHSSKESRQRAMEKMYGDRTAAARIIYDAILAGQMTFEAFLDEMKSTFG